MGAGRMPVRAHRAATEQVRLGLHQHADELWRGGAGAAAGGLRAREGRGPQHRLEQPAVLQHQLELAVPRGVRRAVGGGERRA
eukprot:scaffold58943_cov27-Phaeocystis_antarctica.AAC.1